MFENGGPDDMNVFDKLVNIIQRATLLLGTRGKDQSPPQQCIEV